MPLTIPPYSALEIAFEQRVLPRHPKFPYHNYDGHVVSALGYFESIAEDLAKKEVYLNIEDGRLAIMGHDAGFHEDHLALGYRAKEEHAADITREELADLGVDKPRIDIISGAILTTEVGVIPVSNLEKAVRLADIGNVSADEKEFLRNKVLLLREAHKRGLSFTETFEQDCQNTMNFLNAYIEPAPLFVTANGDEVMLDRQMAFRKNVAKLGTLTLAKLLEKTNMTLPNIPKSWRSQ